MTITGKLFIFKTGRINLDIKDYLNTALLHLGNAHSFIESARAIRGRYVFVHFALIFALLFIPVFFIVIRTQPYEMYQRVFSLRFEGADIIRFSGALWPEYESEPMLPPASAESTAIYVFDDLVVFSDESMTMYAPSGFFDIANMPYTFEEMFSMIAMYNMYIPHLLLPMLMLSMFIVLVLKCFFYAVTAYFLGAFRMNSVKFGYAERLKIAVMSSLPVAVVCTVVGFFVPVVHVILFQMVNLLVMFYLSKRYDAKERELMEGVM